MVEAAPPAGTIRVSPADAKALVRRLLEAVDVPLADADLVADVLASADLRGIRSHGVARVSYFLVRLTRGTINTRPTFSYTSNSPTTGVLDADNAIGIVAANRAMDEALTMASGYGSGFVAVGNSSHFGFAGYWAQKAMQQGCLGISVSSGGRRAAPTYGVESILGTNPISITMPGAGDGTDFYLDMATTAVAVGKIETALREDRPVPPGWTASAAPTPQLDSNGVLDYSAPLLPLGGEGVETGGHKGYGLSLLAELLCGALPGSPLADRLAGADGHQPPAMGHFMGAIKLAGFRPPQDIAAEMEATFMLIRDSAKAPGHDRIFIPGEPEAMAEATNRAEGIPITPPVLANLKRWADQLGVEPITP